MSAVSESMNRRMTLGLLASRYGFDLDPTSAAEVTITSIADDVESVRPGALFVPSADVDVHQLSQAQEQGAYGAIVPHALRGQTDDIQIPLIYAEPTMGQLGKLVSDMAGNPSDALAVFAITGKNREIVESEVRNLADFLSAIDVQRTMAVCAEDGAAAVILALDEETLREDALQSVSVDVLACDDNGLSDAEVAKLVAKFGCAVGKQTRIAGRTQESDLLAAQAATAYGQTDSRSLSLSIAMVLAAGVRKANIKSALRVSRDLN